MIEPFFHPILTAEQVTSAVAGQMLDMFFAAGHRDVDTALMYANGETEKMIGELLPPGSERLARCFGFVIHLYNTV
jgi:aryl-alcohol dehydrogenase-like predicted oxidoreductase